MKIAAFPKAFLEPMIVSRSMTVFEWIDLATQLPVDGLELHTGFFWDESPDERRRVIDALATAGFEMPMLCASPDFTNPDADQRAREFDEQVRAMQMAAEIGGPGTACRVLSGQAHPSVSVEQGLDWASEAITRLLPLASELDITVVIENHYKASTWQYPEFAQRKDVFLTLLERIPDNPRFGVQFDPSNALVAGEDPADFLQVVIDRVRTMQASDRYLDDGSDLASLRQADGTIGYSPALKHGVLGRGLNPYPRIFDILVAGGYDGWISIEDGINGMEEMRESALFLQDARETWFGGARAVSVRALQQTGAQE